MTLDRHTIVSELSYKATQSSGSGGQHVNKVATKVELYFNINDSRGLSDNQKSRLFTALSNRINKNGELMMSCGDTRSQLRNKELVTDRFFKLIEDNLKERKKRKPTKVPKVAKKKRLESKRQQSQKKSNRKPPKLD